MQKIAEAIFTHRGQIGTMFRIYFALRKSGAICFCKSLKTVVFICVEGLMLGSSARSIFRMRMIFSASSVSRSERKLS